MKPRYQEVEDLVNDENFADLLALFNEEIELIETIRGSLRAGDHYHSDPAIQHIREATAAYAALVLPLNILDEHIETLSSNSLLKNEDEDYKVSNLKARAKVDTSVIRRIKAVFKAYVDSAEKIIMTLQSILKALEKEKPI